MKINKKAFSFGGALTLNQAGALFLDPLGLPDAPPRSPVIGSRSAVAMVPLGGKSSSRTA